MTPNRKVALLVVALIFLNVGVYAAKAAPARPSCFIFCHERHPISMWLHTHHAERCHSWHCREKAHEARNRDTSRPRHDSKPVYPCVIHWTYDGVRWWRYHYAVGGSRNHIGLGPRNVRTCLPGQ